MTASEFEKTEVPTDGADEDGSLKGSLGTGGVLFAVLAYNGPLSVVMGFVPVIIFSGGLGSPALFVMGGILLTLFAVGFLAMGRHMKNPGAFYSYATAGLGRPAGVAASFIALFSYYVTLLGSLAYAGLSLPSLVHDTLYGPQMDWWVAALIYAGLLAVLGYFSIELSSKVLGVLLAGELGIILLLNLFVGANVGPSNFDYYVFTPSEWGASSIGLALLFVMLCFGGFEATAVFREEVKDPDRTIPRATYLTIVVIVTMFAISTWMFINGFGASNGFGVDKVVEAAGADPFGATTANVSTYMGAVAVDAVTILLCTSIFASTLACHNIISRYLYNLGVDSVIPHHLGKVHARHGSPHVASIVVSVATISAIAILALVSADPATLYSTLIGVAGYAILILLFVTSVAIIVYLNRHRAHGMGFGTRVVAPGLAVVGLFVSVYLATKNMGLLVGSETRGNLLIALVALIAVAGVGVALYCRAKKPEAYQSIGRQ
ncbi:APC family permease [Rhodococcus sp. NPDC059968]|uniref:APC family permease n=1 Tax=Rhodococcus sp. NPDC059968 TaxID=3347017 RepID=UPI00366F2F66